MKLELVKSPQGGADIRWPYDKNFILIRIEYSFINMPVSNIIRHKKKKRSFKKVLPVSEDVESQEGEESDEEELDGFGGVMEYFEAFIFESIDIRAFFIAAIYFLLSFALPFLNKVK